MERSEQTQRKRARKERAAARKERLKQEKAQEAMELRAEKKAMKRANKGVKSAKSAKGKNSSINAKGKKGKKGKKKKDKTTFFLTFVIALLLMTSVTCFGKVAWDTVMDTKLLGGEDIMLEGAGALNESVELQTLVDENSPFFKTFQEANRANLLLLGVNEGMTDTIMLVSFDMDNKKVDIISVPRDTYYHRSGYNGDAENKINAAYRGDPVKAAYAVSDVLMGMPINYYAVLDYQGVKNIVDAMGGVPVNIPFDMDYDDPRDTPPLSIHFKEGPRTLTGDEAIRYLRYRKDDKKGYGYLRGDIGRIEAQQEFVKSAVKQCLGFDLPKITKTAFRNVKSDIDLGTTLKLATKAMGITGKDITTHMLPHVADGAPPWYVRPIEEDIEELITQIYMPEKRTTSGGITASGVSQ